MADKFDFDDDFGASKKGKNYRRDKFDDFDDFDFPDMDFGDARKDRSVVSRVKSGAMRELASKQAAMSAARSATWAALPPGYQSLYEKSLNVKGTVRDAVDKGFRDLEPARRDLKTVGRAFTPLMETLLPQRIAERYKKLVAKEERYGGSAQNDEQIMATTLAEIFQAQTKGEEIRHKEDKLRDDEERKIDTARFNATSEVNNRIADGIGRLVGYQDQILIKYQMKSLEIQHRQYFAIRDLTAFTKASGTTVMEHMAAISKNSALPDFAKIKGSEIFKDEMVRMLAGRTVLGARDKMAQMAERFSKGLNREIQGFTQALTMITSGAAEMAGMAEDDSGMFDIVEDGTGMIVGGMRDTYAGAAGKKLLARMMKNKTFREFAEMGHLLNTRSGRYVNTLTKSDSVVGRVLAQIMGVTGGAAQEGLDFNYGRDAMQPVPLDMAMRTSIVEVIPWHLSHHGALLEQLVTGNRGTRWTYSPNRMKMVPERVVRSDLVREIESQARQAPKQKLEEMISIIDPSGQLNAEERLELAQVLYTESLKNEMIDYDALVRPGKYAKHGNKIAKVLSETLRISEEGRRTSFSQVDGVGKIYQAGYRADDWLRGRYGDEGIRGLGSSEADIKKRRRFENLFGELTASEVRVQDILNRYNATGNRQYLDQAKIILKNGGANTSMVNEFIQSYLRGSERMSDADYENSLDFGSTEYTSGKGRRPSMASSSAGRTTVRNLNANVNIQPLEELIRSIGQTQSSLLVRIAERLDNGIAVEGFTGGDPAVETAMQREMAELIKSIRESKFGMPKLKPVASWIAEKAKRVAGTASSVAASGFKGGKGFINWAIEQGKIRFEQGRQMATDLYIKGQTKLEPVIAGALLKAGVYLKEDGTPFESIKDILTSATGVYIIDEEGKRVPYLTPEQLKNTFTRYKDDAFGLIARLKARTYDMAGKVVDKAFDAPTIVRNLYNWARFKTNAPFDVYVKGDTKPRLLKLVFDNRGYVTSDGDTIYHPGQIKGAVYDLEGNQCLSAEELVNPGICDVHGKDVESTAFGAQVGGQLGKLAKYARNIGGRILKGGKALLEGGMDLVARGWNTVRGMGGGGGGFTSNAEDLLSKIYEHIRLAWPLDRAEDEAAQRAAGNSGATGKRRRKRTKADKMAEKKARAKAEADNAKDQEAKAAAADSENAALDDGELGARLPMRFRDAASRVGARWQAWRASKREAIRASNAKHSGRGFAGRALGMAADGVMGLGKMGLRGMGMLGKGAFNLTAMMGRALAMAAPVLAKGALLTGAGIAGYQVGKYADKKVREAYKGATDFFNDEPKEDISAFISDILQVSRLERHRPLGALESLRFLYYGISLGDKEAMDNIRLFEQNMQRVVRIKYKTSGVEVVLRKPYLEIYEESKDIFGLTEEYSEMQFRRWFTDRFMRIFARHVLAADRMKVPLLDVDTKLPNKFKASYVKATRFVDENMGIKTHPLDVMYSPWGRKRPLIDTRGMIADLEERIIAASDKGGEVHAKSWDSIVGSIYFGMTQSLESRVAGSQAYWKDKYSKDKAAKDAAEARKLEIQNNMLNPKQYGDRGIEITSKIINSEKNKAWSATPEAMRKRLPDPNGLIMPVMGVITSRLGARDAPVVGGSTNHKGIDIAAPEGTPVRAAASGVVTWAAHNVSGYGSFIAINHPDGRQTRYAHLHSFAPHIKVGVSVVQGEVIGYVGNTGVGTGPHLHFEYRDLPQSMAQQLISNPLGLASANLMGQLSWEKEKSRAVYDPLHYIDGGRIKDNVGDPSKIKADFKAPNASMNDVPMSSQTVEMHDTISAGKNVPLVMKSAANTPGESSNPYAPNLKDLNVTVPGLSNLVENVGQSFERQKTVADLQYESLLKLEAIAQILMQQQGITPAQMAAITASLSSNKPNNGITPVAPGTRPPAANSRTQTRR